MRERTICWTPPGVILSQQPWLKKSSRPSSESRAGTFRLLNRLLTQMDRLLEVNGLHEITKAVVETARDTLVIGEA